MRFFLIHCVDKNLYDTKLIKIHQSDAKMLQFNNDIKCYCYSDNDKEYTFYYHAKSLENLKEIFKNGNYEPEEQKCFDACDSIQGIGDKYNNLPKKIYTLVLYDIELIKYIESIKLENSQCVEQLDLFQKIIKDLKLDINFPEYKIFQGDELTKILMSNQQLQNIKYEIETLLIESLRKLHLNEKILEILSLLQTVENQTNSLKEKYLKYCEFDNTKYVEYKDIESKKPNINNSTNIVLYLYEQILYLEKCESIYEKNVKYMSLYVQDIQKTIAENKIIDISNKLRFKNLKNTLNQLKKVRVPYKLLRSDEIKNINELVKCLNNQNNELDISIINENPEISYKDEEDDADISNMLEIMQSQEKSDHSLQLTPRNKGITLNSPETPEKQKHSIDFSYGSVAKNLNFGNSTDTSNHQDNAESNSSLILNNVENIAKLNSSLILNNVKCIIAPKKMLSILISKFHPNLNIYKLLSTSGFLLLKLILISIDILEFFNRKILQLANYINEKNLFLNFVKCIGCIITFLYRLSFTFAIKAFPILISIIIAVFPILISIIIKAFPVLIFILNLMFQVCKTIYSTIVNILNNIKPFHLTKPPESKSVEKPLESKPLEPKPVEKPPEPKPLDPKSVEKSPESKPLDPKPVEKLPEHISISKQLKPISKKSKPIHLNKYEYHKSTQICTIIISILQSFEDVIHPIQQNQINFFYNEEIC